MKKGVTDIGEARDERGDPRVDRLGGVAPREVGRGLAVAWAAMGGRRRTEERCG